MDLTPSSHIGSDSAWNKIYRFPPFSPAPLLTPRKGSNASLKLSPIIERDEWRLINNRKFNSSWILGHQKQKFTPMYHRETKRDRYYFRFRLYIKQFGLINRQASHCEVLYLVIENRNQPIKFALKNPLPPPPPPRFLPNQRETLFARPLREREFVSFCGGPTNRDTPGFDPFFMPPYGTNNKLC